MSKSMTPQRVRDNFVQNLAENAYLNMCTTEEMNIVISALEKQMPKKPDYEGDGYDENGNLIYDTWICPNCGKHYEVDYDDYDFCPDCGQAIDNSLDWSDEK